MKRKLHARVIALGLTTALTPVAAFAQSAASADTYAVRYDALRRETGTIAPDPDGAGPLGFAATRNTWDAAGRLVRVEKGQLATWQSEAVKPENWTGFAMYQKVETEYDAMSRKTREVSYGGGWPVGVTEYSYDGAGRLKCTAVRMNPDVWLTPLADKCVPGTAHATFGPDRITRNSYDPHGAVTKVERGVGTALAQDYATYTYSPNGKQTSVTDANGNRAEMVYDGLDRQSRWVFPSATTPGVANGADYEEYGYDPNGNRTSLRKRDGGVIGYTYDALNRVTIKDVPGVWDVRYAYDLRGLMTDSIFTATSQGVHNLYDGFGGLILTTSTMGPAARTVTHKYDSDGRRTETGLPGAAAAWFRRDGLGRITDGWQGELGDTSFQMIAFAYHAYGSLYYFSRRYGDGTAFGYDAAARLVSIDDGPGASGSVFSSLSYTPSSQLWQETKNNDAYAWNGAYPASRSYGVNGLNQYTDIVESGAPAGSLGHDANGNIISDGSTTYAYDGENRLVSASGAKNATLVYDPLGRLAQVSSGGAVTQFVYDGDELAAEYNGATGVLTRRYVHGDGDDDPLYWYEGADLSQARFPHTDRQGSIVAIAGAGAQINRYDAWGMPAAGNAGRFQYTGQAWIPELGLYYYKARMYSPGLGRFMQTDPVGYDDQINLYAYVDNDPINESDPSGLKKTGVCIGDTERGCEVIMVEGPDKSDNKPPPAKAGPIPQVQGEGRATVRRGSSQKRSNYCEIGNDIMYVSEQASDASTRLTATGLVIAGGGILAGNPLAFDGGLALANVGNHIGMASAGLQVVGGVAQGYGGGGYKNVAAGAVNIVTGVVISRTLRATIPRGRHGLARVKSQKNNDYVGNAIGALQAVNDWLSPTQADCPRGR